MHWLFHDTPKQCCENIEHVCGLSSAPQCGSIYYIVTTWPFEVFDVRLTQTKYRCVCDVCNSIGPKKRRSSSVRMPACSSVTHTSSYIPRFSRFAGCVAWISPESKTTTTLTHTHTRGTQSPAEQLCLFAETEHSSVYAKTSNATNCRREFRSR